MGIGVELGVGYIETFAGNGKARSTGDGKLAVKSGVPLAWADAAIEQVIAAVSSTLTFMVEIPGVVVEAGVESPAGSQQAFAGASKLLKTPQRKACINSRLI